MAFKLGALAVAIVFAAVFAFIRRKAVGERYRGLRVANCGLPLAIIGLLAAVAGQVNFGIAFVVVAFSFYVIGSIIHVKSMMQRTRGGHEK